MFPQRQVCVGCIVLLSCVDGVKVLLFTTAVVWLVICMSDVFVEIDDENNVPELDVTILIDCVAICSEVKTIPDVVIVVMTGIVVGMLGPALLRTFVISDVVNDDSIVIDDNVAVDKSKLENVAVPREDSCVKDSDGDIPIDGPVTKKQQQQKRHSSTFKVSP